MGRIPKIEVDIHETAVAQFFEERAARYSSETPYTSVLYQDKHPEIALQRDLYEKGRILPLLNVSPSTRVLDIGCGIGRWAEAIGDLESYTGTDISPKLIEIARDRITTPAAAFFVGRAQDINSPDIAARGPFNLVVMSGIMIYLNDNALRQCLLSLGRQVAPGGQIYMREPLAIQDRLTLRDYWSEELSQSYSAIYRNREQLDVIFADTLYPAGIEKIVFEPLYPDGHLNNRLETAQHFAIAKRSETS